ncbi:MAG: hypothetical protein ABI443_09635 [Chthoniobacterales bacterium]
MKNLAPLFLLPLFFLSSCVTGADGKKHFNPWDAAAQEDSKIDDFLENRGYPTSRPETPAPPHHYATTPLDENATKTQSVGAWATPSQ